MRYFARFCLFVAVLFSLPVQAITVVATIPPLAMVADALLQGVGQSVLLVDGRQSPHGMQLLPSQRQALSRADLVLWVSPEFESWLVKPMLQLNKAGVAMQDVAGSRLLSATAAQQGHDHGSSWDLHLWLDPEIVRDYVQAVRDELMIRDSVHAGVYEQNAEQLMANIDRAQAKAQVVLQPVQHEPLLVMHDAWRYFFRRFGLTQGARLQVTPEQSVGAASIAVLERQLQQGELHCMLHEPQFEPKAMAWVRQLAPNMKEALTDPLGNANNVGGYPAWLLQQAKAIAECASVSKD
jgi:zinc transport system substrate-binding protein